MNNYLFQLEKGSRKTICPQCGKKRFKRMVDQNGQLLSEEYGRCDREFSCGYYRHPETRSTTYGWSYSNKWASPTVKPKVEYFYHDTNDLIERLDHYDRNNFALFLKDLFPAEHVDEAIERYWIGTYCDPGGAYTLFPYIDQRKRFSKGKLIRYSRSGSRSHDAGDTSSLRAKLGLDSPREYESSLMFGEHLLTKHPDLAVAVVESEKSAVIGSICLGVFPEMVWLATGSKSCFTLERLKRLRGRKVLAFPDTKGYSSWCDISAKAKDAGIAVVVSDIVERSTTEAEKQRDFDIADYLIREQRKVIAHNWKLDRYMAIESWNEREAIRLEGCGLL